MLTRGAALELAPHGIRVNAVAPGFVPGSDFNPLDDKYVERMAATIPLGRTSGPHDAPEAVVFLASSRAAFVTGNLVHGRRRARRRTSRRSTMTAAVPYPWPQGRRAAVVMSVDFDGPTPFLFNHRDDTRGLLGELEQRRFGPREGVWRLLEIFAELDLHASFYVPGAIAAAHQDAVRADPCRRPRGRTPTVTCTSASTSSAAPSWMRSWSARRPRCGTPASRVRSATARRHGR